MEETENNENQVIETKPEKKIPQIKIKASLLYVHAHDIFETICKLRATPLNNLQEVEALSTNYPGNKDKLDLDLEINDQELANTKTFLRKISNQNVETLMWNEQIFQVVNGLIKDSNQSNNEEIKTHIKNSLPQLKITNFTLFNYLDSMDTCLMIMNQGEEIRQSLLCKNYIYGAVACGLNKENHPVVHIILAEEK